MKLTNIREERRVKLFTKCLSENSSIFSKRRSSNEAANSEIERKEGRAKEAGNYGERDGGSTVRDFARRFAMISGALSVQENAFKN